MTREKQIILAARVVSMIFTPFYLPILGLVVLFFLSYLNQYQASYKVMVLAVVYLFTILLPTLLIHFYRRYQGWSLTELGLKERRIVPYLISILCYFTCLYLMEQMHIPYFMRSIVTAASSRLSAPSSTSGGRFPPIRQPSVVWQARCSSSPRCSALTPRGGSAWSSSLLASSAAAV